MTRRFDSLLLDASCLLNLFTTDRLREIIVALPYQLCVAGYVAEHEALYVRRAGSTDSEEARIPVDLSPLREKGLIQLLCMENPTEEATFVNLAVHLDDGEAITGALALHRDCSIATDDRKARRILSKYAPSLELLSTLELLKLWADETRVPLDELGAAMARMRSGASYVPGPRDPLYSWWQSSICGTMI